MFERRSVKFKTILVPFTVRFLLLLMWRHGVKWDCDVTADVDNGWSECNVPIGSEFYAWNVGFDSCLIFIYFLNHFIIHVIKEIKNGCPCTVEIRCTCALCLTCVPALAYGSCRVSDQGTTMCASDLHNALATILYPFNKCHCVYIYSGIYSGYVWILLHKVILTKQHTYFLMVMGELASYFIRLAYLTLFEFTSQTSSKNHSIWTK